MSGTDAGGPAEGQPFVVDFNVDPNVNAHQFSDRPRNIHRPQEIAEFSYDEDHQIHLDARSLSYYYPPQPLGAEHNIYLDKGVESFRRLDDTQDSHLTGLLAAIMGMEKKQNQKTNAHFIAYRGMITNLLAMPYQRLDEWAMNATFYDGTIFIEEDKAAKFEKKAREAGQQDRGPGQQRRETLQYYYGFKFETLYTIPDIWDNVSRDEIESRDDKVVSNYAQYCSIVKTGVGNIDMVIGGEVDCIWDSKIEGAKHHNYVELKTTEWLDENRLPPQQWQRKMLNYDRRKLKYWAQSYLIGCPTVIVGKKDTDGHIHMPLEVLKTNNIPAAVRNTSGAWNSVVCVQTLGAFLEWLDSHIRDSSGVWKLVKYRNNSMIRLIHIEPTGTGEILTDEFKAHRLVLAQSSLLARLERHPLAEEAGGGGGGGDKMDTDDGDGGGGGDKMDTET
ncbi:Decapping nuclease rai1 [Lasiodiplodia theobromae]|uniref:Decapping nuclease n=1 Tax=Lasiodiplodia theobromae TaxID=45133 RepID=A0A5N5DIZ7_9PEZI|nr:Decapping nuclease rai1 [Lasiodiplodia theobromae]